MSAPIRCVWDGAVFRPSSQFWRDIANRNYKPAELYDMVQQKERSQKSHRHYFASLADAYRNLPDEIVIQFSSVEHFRKRGLIECKYRDEALFAADDTFEADKLAEQVRRWDTYAVVVVRNNIVVVWTAQSQDNRHMDRETFQKSKDDVLSWAWAFCGISPPSPEDRRSA